jgi:hypothetical protein
MLLNKIHTPSPEILLDDTHGNGVCCRYRNDYTHGSFVREILKTGYMCRLARDAMIQINGYMIEST